MIIDYTYFRGEITVAQLSQAPVREDLQLLINKYEKEYLKMILGLGLYKAFIAGIDPISGADQKWLNILQGVDYTHNGRDYEWIGFENSQKESPIANYVYYKYTAKEVELTTGIGQVKPKAENAVIASAVPKMVRAWNEMVDWQRGLIRYLNENKSVYPEWKPYTDYSRWYWDFGSPYYNPYWISCKAWPEIFHKKNTLGI